MKFRVTTLLYAVLALVAAGWLLRSCGGEERRVQKRLETMRELIAKDGEEGALAQADRASRFADLFADGFQIAVEPYDVGIGNRQELLRAFASYRAGPERIDARFRDLELELGPGGRTATAVVVASLTARWSDRAPGREAYRLELRLVKDREWRFREIVVTEMLEGPERFF